jgi:hypothetical protein
MKKRAVSAGFAVAIIATSVIACGPTVSTSTVPVPVACATSSGMTVSMVGRSASGRARPEASTSPSATATPTVVPTVTPTTAPTVTAFPTTAPTTAPTVAATGTTSPIVVPTTPGCTPVLPKGAAGSVILSPNAVSVNYNNAEAIQLTDFNAPNGPFTTSGCANVVNISVYDPQTDDIENGVPLVAGPIVIVLSTINVGPQTCVVTFTDPYGASATLNVTTTSLQN